VTRNVYTANVVGENLIANDMEAGTDPTPLLVGSEGLIVLYGDRSSGLTALVLADDEDEGEAGRALGLYLLPGPEAPDG
jgi:hypothetical protein